MPIRDIGSNYRNKIHQMMEDVGVIKQNLSEGLYIRISYPSERQIIYMRADKITPVESSFYGISIYEGIIDLSFRGPAYVYTYDQFENPINLECYENYNLNNAINRNTSGTADDPDSIDVISESDFHDAFMELMDKFYFNNYIWPAENTMFSTARIKDYKMAMFFKKVGINYPIRISEKKYKIDIIFQIPGNLNNANGKISFVFVGENHTLELVIADNKFTLIYDGDSIYYYNFDFSEGDQYYQEDKFHVVIRNLGDLGYIYIESLRTGKRTYSALRDIRIAEAQADMVIISDPMIGIERLRVWDNGSLVTDIVPLEDVNQSPTLYDLISLNRIIETNGKSIESW